jgi:hypothetical protein
VGWTILDMTYNIDPITQACYRTFEEFGLGLDKQAKLLYPDTVINNVVFQFGNIFDSVRDVLLFMVGDSRGEFNLPYDAGYGLGNAIHLVMLPDPEKLKPAADDQ